MNISDIIGILEENNLTDITELLVEDDHAVVEFFYDFDSDEIKAAKAYSDEESDLEEGSSEWKRDFYIPYLLDIAKDNVQSIIEEITDELELESKFIEADIDSNNNDYIKFKAAFCEDSYNIDLEELLNDYL